mgnify:CR=1 FL=1
MYNQISISFYFQSYVNSKGENALNLRVTQGRLNRMYIPTPIKLKKKLWDAKNELISSKHPNAKILNKAVVMYKNVRAEAIAKFQARTDDKPFGFLSVCNYMQGKQDITSLDTYVNTYIKTSTDEATYINTSERLRYFKQQINHKGDLYFEDVNNVLFSKYRKVVDKKIKDKEGSTTTYKAYLSTVLSICKEAFDNEHVDKEIRISDKNKKFKKFDYGENPSNSFKEVAEAINNITTLQRFEAAGNWLLMFGLRGFYPADIVKMNEGQLYKNAFNGKRTPFIKVNENRRKDWVENNLWLDYRRSKSATPMFVKLTPTLLKLIEKLKYSYMHTHTDYQIDNKYIVADVNKRLSILDYSVNDNPKEHKSLWRNRQKLLPLFSELTKFKDARKTFYQLADDITDELTAKKLVGQTTDSLSKNFYSKYNTEAQVKKLDNAHRKVLLEFNFDKLVFMLLQKFNELVETNVKVPKWLLKQSAVLKKGNEWRVLIGIEDRKPIFEEIPTKYKRFLDDRSADDDYWIDIDEKDSVNEKVLERLAKQTKTVEQTDIDRIAIEVKKADIETKLNKAVEVENYEDASKYRDKLKQLETA